MAKRMRANQYTVVRLSGEVKTMSVPTVFDPFEVADKLPHNQVYLHIKRGFNVTAKSTTGLDYDYVEGPAVCMIVNGEYYRVPRAPESDAEAFHQWHSLPTNITGRAA